MKTSNEQQAMHEFLVSQTPIPRKISKACYRLLADPVEEPDAACPECLKLKDSKAVNLATAAAECKVEIMSGRASISRPQQLFS